MPIWATSGGGAMARSAWHQSVSRSERRARAAEQARRPDGEAARDEEVAHAQERARGVAEGGLDDEERPARREQRGGLLEEGGAAGVRVGAREQLVHDVAHRHEVEAAPLRQLGERTTA